MSQSSSTSVSGDVSFAGTEGDKPLLFSVAIGAVLIAIVVWLISRK